MLKNNNLLTLINLLDSNKPTVKIENNILKVNNLKIDTFSNSIKTINKQTMRLK